MFPAVRRIGQVRVRGPRGGPLRRRVPCGPALLVAILAPALSGAAAAPALAEQIMLCTDGKGAAPACTASDDQGTLPQQEIDEAPPRRPVRAPAARRTAPARPAPAAGRASLPAPAAPVASPGQAPTPPAASPAAPGWPPIARPALGNPTPQPGAARAGEPASALEPPPGPGGLIHVVRWALILAAASMLVLVSRPAGRFAGVPLLGRVRAGWKRHRPGGEDVTQAGLRLRRLERNIHDGLQQELVALTAKLTLARTQLRRDPEVADGTLVELQGDTRRALEALRDLARGVDPTRSPGGLVEAVERCAALAHLPVIVEVDPEVREAARSQVVESAAYFFVSEALTNALKHAGAQGVLVRLGVTASALVLEVVDDGQGFLPEEASGTGLAGLRERVSIAGGTLEIESNVGQGTRLRATFPRCA